MRPLEILVYYVPCDVAAVFFVPCGLFFITLQNREGCWHFYSPSFEIPLGPFTGDVFRGSFDVAGVDIVFEVCVFDAYSSLETMSQGGKIMTHKQRGKKCRVVVRNLH